MVVYCVAPGEMTAMNLDCGAGRHGVDGTMVNNNHARSIGGDD
jgi:hypothetical protein